MGTERAHRYNSYLHKLDCIMVYGQVHWAKSGVLRSRAAPALRVEVPWASNLLKFSHAPDEIANDRMCPCKSLIIKQNYVKTFKYKPVF